MCLSVGIETEQNAPVDQGILLLSPGSLLYFPTSGTNNRLDFIAINETGDIRVGNLGRRKAEKHVNQFHKFRGQKE